MSSALAHPEMVDEYLLKELIKGSIAGPFLCKPIEELHINRFGLIPKQLAGEWRMIIDLSFPWGSSVNDFIPDSEASVKFSCVDECGRRTMMAKFDIKSAYRILPSHTSRSLDRSLIGMLWKKLNFH